MLEGDQSTQIFNHLVHLDYFVAVVVVSGLHLSWSDVQACLLRLGSVHGRDWHDDFLTSLADLGRHLCMSVFDRLL